VPEAVGLDPFASVITTGALKIAPVTTEEEERVGVAVTAAVEVVDPPIDALNKGTPGCVTLPAVIPEPTIALVTVESVHVIVSVVGLLNDWKEPQLTVVPLATPLCRANPATFPPAKTKATCAAV